MSFSGGAEKRTWVKLIGNPGTFMHFCGFELHSNTGRVNVRPYANMQM